MVNSTELKNKETGELLKTKEGEQIYKNVFEAEDVFIPQLPKVVEVEGGKDSEGKTIINQRIPVIVKDQFEEESIFIDLTPSQANTLNRKIKNGEDITQNLFRAYTYYDKDKIQRIGIGYIPKSKTPKTFKDFEKPEEESESAEETIEESKSE